MPLLCLVNHVLGRLGSDTDFLTGWDDFVSLPDVKSIWSTVKPRTYGQRGWEWLVHSKHVD